MIVSILQKLKYIKKKKTHHTVFHKLEMLHSLGQTGQPLFAFLLSLLQAL